MTRSFNLSDWALRHKSFVLYLMLVAAAAGSLRLRQARPGGRPALHDQDHDREDAVAGRHDVRDADAGHGPHREEARGTALSRFRAQLYQARRLASSLSTSGQHAGQSWFRIFGTRCERRSATSRSSFRPRFRGPFFNDEFGDTYSASSMPSRPTASPRARCATNWKKFAPQLLRIPDVAKVDFIGTQDEKIYLEFSTRQMAALGIDASTLMDSLAAQNAIVPSGVLDAGEENISVRVSGSFDHAGKPEVRQPAAWRPLLPAERHCHHPARLRRSAAADAALQWRAGHRTGRSR